MELCIQLLNARISKHQLNELDNDFKPGIFNQTKNFLEGKNNLFCSLSEQSENMKTYSNMAGYRVI